MCEPHIQRDGARGAAHGLIEKLRGRYVSRDQYALVVDVRGGGRAIRATLVGRQQAEATAVGVGAIAEALWSREVDAPGVWLAEQVIAPRPFLARLATYGIVPVIEELSRPARAADSMPASAR